MGSSFSCCDSDKVNEGYAKLIRVIFFFYNFICAEVICFFRVPSSNDPSTWRIFTFKELHSATNGFSEDNKLGEGGFGSVFWGKTSDGLQIYDDML
ncbi:putative non-specific protein-tyrosine kinase [Helianthus debilis subsp. tardiflorus]